MHRLMTAHSAENIAAAYLRLQLAARPAPEELLDAPIPYESEGRKQRGERPERGDAGRNDASPRDRSDFDNGVWFRVTVGRKHRAEPRWLLPMICKAGRVTKKSVGSIKILDTESQFEIAGDQAEAFAAAIREQGTGEKGVTIQRIDGSRAQAEPQAETSWKSAKKPKLKPKDEGVDAANKPVKKARWKKTKKL